MIDRIVQRPFLLWQAEAAAAAGAAAPAAPLPPGAEEPSPALLADAQRELAAAVARERRTPPQAPPTSAGGRRGEAAASPDLRAYFPRDPILSIAQSALELYIEEHAARLLKPAVVGTDRRRAAAAPSPVADYELAIDDAAIPPDAGSDRRLGGAIEVTDPRWVSALVAMGWGKLKGRRPFPSSPAPPWRLAEDAQVVVVGDWASGIARARRVAEQIRKVLDDPQAGGRECHVIHLGDTYYAGWDHEYRKRFLPNWPVRAGEPHGSWSLNGNHDMYTGGHGYFEVLLEEPRFASCHRGSSWFSLENEHWQLLGLDTAWEDHDLAGGQASWVEERLRESPGRRTMLLSHHQPFSAFGGGGAKLERRLRAPLASGRVDAWLWGHEHRCVVYEPARGVAAPRCIGHGGVPVYADRSRPASVRWRLDASFRAGLEEWALFGFAVLDFDGPEITVRFVDEGGAVGYTETI